MQRFCNCISEYLSNLSTTTENNLWYNYTLDHLKEVGRKVVYGCKSDNISCSTLKKFEASLGISSRSSATVIRDWFKCFNKCVVCEMASVLQ